MTNDKILHETIDVDGEEIAVEKLVKRYKAWRSAAILNTWMTIIMFLMLCGVAHLSNGNDHSKAHKFPLVSYFRSME